MLFLLQSCSNNMAPSAPSIGLEGIKFSLSLSAANYNIVARLFISHHYCL